MRFVLVHRGGVVTVLHPDARPRRRHRGRRPGRCGGCRRR
jgi:hypothetical protein